MTQGLAARAPESDPRAPRTPPRVVRRAHLLRLRGQGEGVARRAAPWRAAEEEGRPRRARGQARQERQGPRRASADLERAVEQLESFREVLVPGREGRRARQGAASARRRESSSPATSWSTSDLLGDFIKGFIKSTPRVTGFVGGTDDPPAISEAEVREITQQMEEGAAKPKVLFESGENVKVDRRTLPGLQRRRRRGEARQGKAPGADQHLRTSDARRARVRPGREGVGGRVRGEEGHRGSQAPDSGGRANPSPPVGPALGQRGVNIMEFCKAFNAQTQAQAGLIIPVIITVYADRSFTFITKTPPASVLLKKAAGLEKGSGEPTRARSAGQRHASSGAGDRQAQDARSRAEHARGRERTVAGTARSMGLEVVD